MSDNTPPLSEDDLAAFPGTPRPGLTDADRRKPIPEWGRSEEEQHLWIGLLAAFFLFLLFGGGLAMLGIGDGEDGEVDLEEIAADVASGDVDVDLDVDAGLAAGAAAGAALIDGDEDVATTTTLAVETTVVADDLLERVREAEVAAGFGSVGVAEPEAGAITLTGEVESEEAREEAEAAALAVEGVESVDNQLTVAADEGALDAALRAAENEAGFSEIGTAVDGSTAVLTGEVPTQEDMDAAVAAALAVDGIDAVENQLTLPAAELPPSELLFEVDGETLTLSGSVPDADVATAVEDGVGDLISETASVEVGQTGETGTVAVTGTATDQAEFDATSARLSALADELGYDFDDSGYTVAAEPEVPELQRQLNEVFALENVNFEVGSAVIVGGESAVLDEAAAILIENPDAVVTVEGHTDAQGEEADNLALSQARAEAVVEYLEFQGVAAGQLTPQGFGETTPIAPNETAEGRAQNRRVQFSLAE